MAVKPLGYSPSGNVDNVDLDVIAVQAANADANADAALDSFPQTNGRTVASLATYLANNALFNVKDYGAIGNGVADDAAAIALANTQAMSAGRGLYFPQGTYRLADTRVEITASQFWEGDGIGKSIIVFDGAPSVGNSVNLDVFGPSLTQIAEAPTSVARGATAVVFGADPGALSGLLVLRDSADGSFNAARTDYKAGEIVEIASQVAETVNIKGRTFGAYTASGTFDAFTFAPIQFRMRGLEVRCDSAVNLGVRFRRTQFLTLEACRFTGGSLETVEIGEYCYQASVRGSFAINETAAASDQYAWALTGVQEVSMVGCFGVAARHALAMGGSSIPNRRVLVTGGQFSLTSEAQGQAAVDCHGNAEWIAFVGNECEGALLAGDNIRFTENQINGRGQGVGLREMLGSNFEVSDNDILTYFPNPTASRANGVTFQSGATGAFTTRGGHLRIEDNRIVYAGASARPGIFLSWETGFALGASTRVTVQDNDITLPIALAVGLAVNGLAASPIATITVRHNTVLLGGVDMRHGSVMVADDNDVRGGTAQGLLLRNIGTGEADQTAYARRNHVQDCGFAGVAVQGDTTNPFGLVRLEDNDLPSNSETNQGSSSLEAAIIANDVELMMVYRNTALVAGANQTNDYSFDATVDVVQLFQNNWIVGTVVNTAGSILQDNAQTYNATNVTPDRAYDADTVLIAELADVVGTLIADLRAARMVK